MSDKDPPKKPSPSHKPLSIEELRWMVREDIEQQRKILESIRRKLN